MPKTLEAKKIPTLLCVGTVRSISELNYSQSSDYVYEKVEIHGDAADTDRSFNLLWKPSFFDPNMGVFANDGEEFVYTNYVQAREGDPVSKLTGMCGSMDAWEKLAEITDNLPEYEEDVIHSALKTFFNELGLAPFIYTLRQEMKKQTGVGGEIVRVPTKYYEVDRIQHLTEGNVKRLVKSVERNAKRIANAKDTDKVPAPIVFKFEPSDYDINVAVPVAEIPTWARA